MKQPKALLPLFLTEMWERYGYYIFQALLILYMTRALHLSDVEAATIVGAFSALAFIMPSVGGIIADRILGFRNAIVLGGALLTAGYAIAATQQHTLFIIGLATIVSGTGFLKPNISSYLGEFYEEHDPRRDAGFTIFYIGINTGVLIATASSGFIQQYLGWSMTFASAALGMSLGLLTFWWGYRYFGDAGRPPQKLLKSDYTTVTLTTLGIIIFCSALFSRPEFANWLLNIFGAAMLIYLLYLTRQYEGLERKRFLALIILIAFSVVFWGLYVQVFFSIILFLERSVDRYVFGYQLPAIFFLSTISIVIMTLGTAFAYMWKWLQQRGHDLSSGMKFAFAMFGAALSMGTLVYSISITPAGEHVALGWMLLFFLLITIGELFISPIGLSIVTKLAPPRLTGFMMGIWFMALGFGAYFAGQLAKLSSVPKGTTDVTVINHIYQQAFTKYTLIAAAVGAILLLLSPWLKRLEKHPS